MFIRRNKSRKVSMENVTVGEEGDKGKQDPSLSQPKLPKRPRIPATTTLETVTPIVPQPEEEEEEGTCAVVTLKDSDSDLLECPICYEPFRSSVYQCENGHLSCDSCCKEVHHKCPTCSKALGFIRNRFAERIVELAIMSCRNRQHGCKVRLCYLEKMEHEKECQYTLAACPLACQYIGVPMSFHNHFNEKHLSIPESITLNRMYEIRCVRNKTNLEQVFFLRERNKKLLFVVHCIMDPLGCFVHVCAPPTASGIDFSYDLANAAGRSGNSIKVESSVEVTPKCFVTPAKENCLLFPVAFHSELPDYGLVLNLVIKEKNRN